jgi:hypothetical protein
MDRSKVLTVFVLVAAAAATRLLPHPPNFVPLAALGTFAAVYAPSRTIACAIVIAAMLFSDLALGMHVTLPFVYGALVLNVLVSAFLLRPSAGQESRMQGGVVIGNRFERSTAAAATESAPSIVNIAGTSLLNSLLFFFVTNFGVWAVQNMYPRTITGLVSCYTAALPFLKYSVVADLLYTAVLFSAFLAIRRSSQFAGAR